MTATIPTAEEWEDEGEWEDDATGAGDRCTPRKRDRCLACFLPD